MADLFQSIPDFLRSPRNWSRLRSRPGLDFVRENKAVGSHSERVDAGRMFRPKILNTSCMIVISRGEWHITRVAR